MAVKVQTNGGQYAARMYARGAALMKNVAAVQDRIAKEALNEARWQSSGPFKQRELTRRGHPYARRHQVWESYVAKSGKSRRRRVMPAAQQIGQDYPARANVQSGDFLRGWKVSKGGRTANGTPVVTLYNRSKHAKWLTGRRTKRMVGRPVMQAIARRLRPRISKYVREAVQGAYRSPTVSRGLFRPDIVGSFRRGYAFGSAISGGV